MRIFVSKHSSEKLVSRLKKKARIRQKVKGSSARPRLCVFRSTNNLYAQIVDDSKGLTLASASTLELDGVKGANKDSATRVGRELAKRALAKDVTAVVFDRNGYLYHGKVKALAEAAREAGLKF